ncbi:imidazolonepropionase [Mariniblastus sp.]|nr:imidazolonepropionase [Mariniblastus sp.]
MAEIKTGLSVVESVFVNFRVASMGDAAEPYGVMHDVAIGVADSMIQWIVPQADLPKFGAEVQIIDGQNKWLTPGLIDCHTHLVYGGNRANEWEMRLGGVPYEEIAKQGGGILSSVKSTREATEDQLVDAAVDRLTQLASEGVTTVEVKSGYGLDVDTEFKMLRAAKRVGDRCGIHVETTLLGAHAVPPEFKGRVDQYLDLVCSEMIPTAANENLCSAVDAFCESIAFDVKQTKRVFKAALDVGLKIKVHAEQLSDMGMAAEAARMGAISADHLEYLAAKDCQVLAANQTVATLLPGAFYCLRETQKPPVAALIENEVPIAIATDSNPGSSPMLSLLLAGNMACNLFGMTPEMALAGITRNAAKALALPDRGEIRVGLRADFSVWDVGSPAEILYQIGGNPCAATYRGGKKRAS